MVDARSKNPADLMKYHSDGILDARNRVLEALADMKYHSEQLLKVTTDSGQRLLTRE